MWTTERSRTQTAKSWVLRQLTTVDCSNCSQNIILGKLQWHRKHHNLADDHLCDKNIIFRLHHDSQFYNNFVFLYHQTVNKYKKTKVYSSMKPRKSSVPVCLFCSSLHTSRSCDTQRNEARLSHITPLCCLECITAQTSLRL